MDEPQKCERVRCRKDALPGSRWCKGHGYVGEHYVTPNNRDPIGVAIQDEVDRRTKAEGESLGAVILRRLGLKR